MVRSLNQTWVRVHDAVDVRSRDPGPAERTSSTARSRSTAAIVRELVDLARYAPNHKLTQPWRFRAARDPRREPGSRSSQARTKLVKLRRAPTLVLATAGSSGDPCVDEEDLHATACAVYASCSARRTRGLASYWRTPSCFARGARPRGARARAPTSGSSR